MAGRVAVGFRCHTGWAVLVAVTGSPAAPVVLARQRVELVADPLPRQPYHAIVEGGHPPAVIEAVADDATRRAAAAIRSIEGVGAVGLVATPRNLPETLEQILPSHTRWHAAEGALYEEAVIEAAAQVELPIELVEPRTIQVPASVESLRRTIGPPWAKDHKWAACVALEALTP